MTHTNLTRGAMLACLLLGTASVCAQDWPQWRGPNRDARATGFKAPAAWPKELMKKWSVPVGDGVATPALVGDKLYVFSRQGGDEITRCLDAATGKEVWQDKYQAAAASGPARSFPGPRCSPTVSDGKVVTLGVQGMLSCLDAATGKVLWRKDDIKGKPRFFTSSSPIVLGGVCIAQLGGESGGAIVAYDLASGAQKWKWADDGTAYASPVLLTVADTKGIVAETAKNIVAINAEDGKFLWKTPFAVSGRGYNAVTPMVDGQTVIYAGDGRRGAKAVKVEKKGGELAATQLWSNPDASCRYNTPVLKDGLLFGITENDRLFCLNTKDGKTAWTTSLKRGGGYGSVVDAGSALVALNPSGEMVVFEPSDKEYKQLAKYQVAAGGTYAYPILSGNRVFIKDKDAVTLWTVD